jgi:hypothetical protein
LATLQRGKVENFKNPAIFLLFSEKKLKNPQNLATLMYFFQKNLLTESHWIFLLNH